MMKKILASVLIIIIAGCSSLHIEKRRYLKGYSLTFNKRMKTNTSIASKDTLYTKVQAKQIIQVKTAVPSDVEKEKLKPTSNVNQPIESYTTRYREEKKSIQNINNHKDDITVNTEKETAKNLNTIHKKKRTNGLWYFLSLLMIPFIFKLKGPISKGSRWAANNVSKARPMIALLAVGSVTSNYLLGNVLQVGISPSMFAVPIVLGAGAVALKYTRISRIGNFIKGKTSFLLMNLSVSFISFSAGAIASPMLSTSAIQNEDPYILSIAAMILFSILLIAVCLCLAYVTLVISCELSCNGAQAAANAVLIGGVIFILSLLVFGFYMIFRRESDVLG